MFKRLGVLFVVSLFSAFISHAQVADVSVSQLPVEEKPKNSTVRGRVFYADTGRAVKRASVMLMPEDLGGGPSQNLGLTDGNGYFVIKNVVAGTYYAVVNAPGVVSPLAFADFSAARGRVGREAEQEAFAAAFQHFEKIIVNGITDLDVQIAARRGAAIGGRVIYDDGDAAIGVKVEILRKVDGKFLGVIPNFSAFASMLANGGFGSLNTDDRGFYRLSGLPPGEYVVRVTENTTHTETLQRESFVFEFGIFGGSSFLTVFYPDVFEQEKAEVISVDYGQEVTDINLIIPSRNLFKISGKIVSRKDKSPVKAKITIQRAETEKVFSVGNTFRPQPIAVGSDLEGKWLFNEVPKGKYKLTIEPVNAPDQYEYNYDYPSNTNVAVKKKYESVPKLAKKVQEITIEDQDINDLTFELSSGATLSGTITVENLPNEMPQYISITSVNEDNYLTETTAVSNYRYEGMPQPTKINREFKLDGVSEGKTRLELEVSDDDFYVKSATVGDRDLLTGELELKDGENLSNIKIVLSKTFGRLKVKVINEDGQPLKSAKILLVPTDARRRNPMFRTIRQTDESGAFYIELPPAEYALILLPLDVPDTKSEQFRKWLDEAIGKAEKVKIEAGKTETFNLTRKK